MAALLRRARNGIRGATLPAPRMIVRPYLAMFLVVRGAVFFLRRTLVAEPLFKAYCTRVGKGVTTGIYVPWVQGNGQLIVGDHVRVSGKLNIAFAASIVPNPLLVIGDHSDLAHDTRFVVAREIRIGRHVQVAGGVTFRDSSGHPADPARRRAGNAPDPDDVKPIVVHDDVWIGSGALVMPGTEIGEGSIVSAHSVVSGTIAPYTIVAGNPARRIGTLAPPPGRAHDATGMPSPTPSKLARSDVGAAAEGSAAVVHDVAAATGGT